MSCAHIKHISLSMHLSLLIDSSKLYSLHKVEKRSLTECPSCCFAYSESCCLVCIKLEKALYMSLLISSIQYILWETEAIFILKTDIWKQIHLATNQSISSLKKCIHNVFYNKCSLNVMFFSLSLFTILNQKYLGSL